MFVKTSVFPLLQTFDIAAKHLSFTKAAVELNVTQGAISHRIRHLESLLGFKLFIRLTRNLELTDKGRRLSITINNAIESIGGEIYELMNEKGEITLTIGISPTFAQLWLLPRLPHFQQMHPEINIRLNMSSGSYRFNDEDMDLAVYYGCAIYPDVCQERLIDERLIPVCSIEYMESLNLKNKPENLNDAFFIHATETIDSMDYFLAWQLWCQKNNMPAPYDKKYYSFNNYHMALQAARNGMGIAMGRETLARPLINAGILCCPFDLTVSPGYGYDLIYKSKKLKNNEFNIFSEWLRKECCDCSKN